MIDKCWRCGAAGALKEIDVGRGKDFRVDCTGCGSIGLTLYTETQAVEAWNDGQRKYRGGLTDTVLLEKTEAPAAGAQPATRDDLP